MITLIILLLYYFMLIGKWNHRVLFHQLVSLDVGNCVEEKIRKLRLMSRFLRLKSKPSELCNRNYKKITIKIISAEDRYLSAKGACNKSWNKLGAVVWGCGGLCDAKFTRIFQFKGNSIKSVTKPWIKNHHSRTSGWIHSETHHSAAQTRISSLVSRGDVAWDYQCWESMKCSCLGCTTTPYGLQWAIFPCLACTASASSRLCLCADRHLSRRNSCAWTRNKTPASSAWTKGTEIHHCLASTKLYMSYTSYCCPGDTDSRSFFRPPPCCGCW